MRKGQCPSKSPGWCKHIITGVLCLAAVSKNTYINSASLQLDTGNMWMGYDIVPKFVLNCGLIEKHTTMKTDPRDGRCRKTMKNSLI